MSSPTQKLRNYITTLLESEDTFDSSLKSLDIHYYLFFELSLSPICIFELIESLLNEYQPSASATSYYIDYHNRYKLFLILSHLINNPNNYYHSKNSKHDISTNQLSNMNKLCQKLRDYVAPKLHSLIFNLVFPCKSAVQSQYDGIKKICESWSNQNIFCDMKTFVLKNVLKDLNNKSIRILNEEDWEEPSNLNEFLNNNTNNNHNNNNKNNIHQTPSYIQLPPTFNKNNNCNNNEYYGRGNRAIDNRGGYNEYYGGNPMNQMNQYRYGGNEYIAPRGRGRGLRGMRGMGRDRGRGRARYEYNSYQTQANNHIVSRNNRSRSRSRSKSKSKTQTQTKDDCEKQRSRDKVREKEREKQREKEKEKEEYENICKLSVINGVNGYPETKEFRDEDKMWRLECENKRKEQRRQRIQCQLKLANENLSDQFEKFFNEGMKRWDLVPKCCLDKRIWEWQINLNYNDCTNDYGFGNSQIRHSPFFKK